MSVDVGSDDKGNHVEEWYPGLLRKELLRKGKRDRRGDPADSHHRPKAGADGGAHLVPGAGARDEGHAREVDGVLNWRDLRFFCQYGCARTRVGRHTIRLLVRIWRIFARRLVRPAKTFWSK